MKYTLIDFGQLEHVHLFYYDQIDQIRCFLSKQNKLSKQDNFYDVTCRDDCNTLLHFICRHINQQKLIHALNVLQALNYSFSYAYLIAVGNKGQHATSSPAYSRAPHAACCRLTTISDAKRCALMSKRSSRPSAEYRSVAARGAVTCGPWRSTAVSCGHQSAVQAIAIIILCRTVKLSLRRCRSLTCLLLWNCISTYIQWAITVRFKIFLLTRQLR